MLLDLLFAHMLYVAPDTRGADRPRKHHVPFLMIPPAEVKKRPAEEAESLLLIGLI